MSLPTPLLGLGQVLLATAALGLTSYGVLGAVGDGPFALGGVLVLLVLGQYRVVVHESTHLWTEGVAAGFNRADARTAAAVAVGALVTYPLSVHVGLGPVVAAALVGVLSPFLADDYAVPAYCGSFVGMTSSSLFTYEQLALASLVAGSVYVASESLYGGFGGKLGTVAFVGCAATAAATGARYPTAAVEWTVGSALLAVAGAAAAATYLLSARLGYSAVFASGSVGLLGGVVLPHVPGTGPLAAAAFCATFAGMSSDRRLPTVTHAAAAGTLSGVLFTAVASYFVGAGGKLGTVAFAACLAVRGFDDLRSFVAGSG